MKRKSASKKSTDVNLNEFFKMVDQVAIKALKDKSSKKIIDSAAQKWETNSRYAI